MTAFIEGGPFEEEAEQHGDLVGGHERQADDDAGQTRSGPRLVFKRH